MTEPANQNNEGTLNPGVAEEPKDYTLSGAVAPEKVASIKVPYTSIPVYGQIADPKAVAYVEEIIASVDMYNPYGANDFAQSVIDDAGKASSKVADDLNKLKIDSILEGLQSLGAEMQEQDIESIVGKLKDKGVDAAQGAGNAASRTVKNIFNAVGRNPKSALTVAGSVIGGVFFPPLFAGAAVGLGTMVRGEMKHSKTEDANVKKSTNIIMDAVHNLDDKEARLRKEKEVIPGALISTKELFDLSKDVFVAISLHLTAGNEILLRANNEIERMKATPNPDEEMDLENLQTFARTMDRRVKGLETTRAIAGRVRARIQSSTNILLDTQANFDALIQGIPGMKMEVTAAYIDMFGMEAATTASDTLDWQEGVREAARVVSKEAEQKTREGNVTHYSRIGKMNEELQKVLQDRAASLAQDKEDARLQALELVKLRENTANVIKAANGEEVQVTETKAEKVRERTRGRPGLGGGPS